MYRCCFSLLAVLVCTCGFSQRTENVYLNPKDSSSNVYITVYPTKLPYKGYMLLIPGMFQKPQEVLRQTDLPMIAARQGILTFIPTFKTGIGSLGFDTATQASLRDFLDHAKSRYKLANHRLFIGGFSIGGTCAIKYAELALRNNYPIKPSAVFAIDSPLDFERMYNTSVRELRFAGTNEEIAAENKYMLKRFEREFGGAPADFLAVYQNGSPYSFTDTTRYAISPLVNFPIRLYIEPDIQWALRQGVDYYGMNAFDFAAMTNDLKRMGSKKITLITTIDKGYRKPDNKRNPHSWSIAEPHRLIKWLLLQN